jgi:hypothetical protein
MTTVSQAKNIILGMALKNAIRLQTRDIERMFVRMLTAFIFVDIGVNNDKITANFA